MTSQLVHARALLEAGAVKLERTRRHVNGYRAIASSLGDNVARWAYADCGDELDGHRIPSDSERALTKWRPSPADWCIVLSGPTGRGKTIAAARYVADRGGVMIRATDADRWGFGGGERLRELEHVRLLLIDDIGDEKTKPGVDNLSTLISNRGAAGRTVVATTTWSPDDVKARGDHFTSRLRPHFRPVGLTEPDRRSKIAPLQRGIMRAFEVVGWEPRLRMVADGTLVGVDAATVLGKAAELLGIDLTGQRFADAVAAERARVERVEALALEAVELLEQMCEATTRRLGDPAIPEVDDAALTWLDDLELEFPDPDESEDDETEEGYA